MMNINCYTTSQDDLAKTFCQLAEKCYYSNIRTNVITHNPDYTKSLDRVLWTYSKKHFIPHATNTDPLPEKQLIYITDKLENPNNAESIIFINPTNIIINEATTKSSAVRFDQFQKIYLIFDDMQKTSATKVNEMLKKSSAKKYKINFFVKNDQGMWQKPLINNLS